MLTVVIIVSVGSILCNVCILHLMIKLYSELVKLMVFTKKKPKEVL